MLKNVVITCSNEKYGDFLVNHWLRSLKENVNLDNTDVVVIDYGLNLRQLNLLQQNNALIIRGSGSGHVVNLRFVDTGKFLKKQNFQIIALEQDKNAIDIRRLKVKASGKIALVLGYEVKGVSKSVLKQCDKITEIPMFGKKESLNVAVAFGIAGYWIKFSERKE